MIFGLLLNTLQYLLNNAGRLVSAHKFGDNEFLTVVAGCNYCAKYKFEICDHLPPIDIRLGLLKRYGIILRANGLSDISELLDNGGKRACLRAIERLLDCFFTRLSLLVFSMKF